MKIAHAYGDAGPVNTLLRELVRAAAEERPARVEPQSRHRTALPRAWLRAFAPPRRWRQALTLPRTPAVTTVDPRPWTPALTVETARSSEVLATMRAWRDEHAPGVSTSAITFAAFAGALRELGLDPDLSGGTFLVDARRYLDPSVRIDSNFCFGPYLRPADMTDPVAVHQALKRELADGGFLTMMLLREAKIAVAGGPGMPDPYPSEVSASPRPRLTLSNQGRHDVLADLPWAIEPPYRINESIPTRSAPDGITLTTSEMGGVLHLEATFHASTFDPALVARALQLVCASPASLITPVG
jgi:hypothetical protein